MAYSEVMNARVPLSLVASLLLVVPACGSEEQAGGDSNTIEIAAQDFAFSTVEIEADPSEEVSIEFDNGDGTTHTFTIDEVGLDLEAPGGETVTGTFDAPDGDATLVFYCRFHPQMKGTVLVGAGGDAPAGGDTEENEGDETGEGVNENDDGIDY
jgi:plastocyanin